MDDQIAEEIKAERLHRLQEEIERSQAAFNRRCVGRRFDVLFEREGRFYDELPARADPAPGPALLAERKDDAERLRRAIDELPEKYRTVITLYHLQGKQYEEIATVLNLPLGTVKTHLFRAKELLRKALTT